MARSGWQPARRWPQLSCMLPTTSRSSSWWSSTRRGYPVERWAITPTRQVKPATFLAFSRLKQHYGQTVLLSRVQAVFLAIALSSVSCWASVCELSCSLADHCSGSLSRSFGSGYEVEHEQERGHHAHCGHAAVTSLNNLNCPIAQNAPMCRDGTCQSQALSSPEKIHDNWQAHELQLGVAALEPKACCKVVSGTRPDEKSPPRALTPDGFSTNLRI